MRISWGLLSRYREELYGISIIWIVLFHGIGTRGVQLPKFLNFAKPFLQHGNCGVEVFLFMSGICLYFSFKNCNNLKDFYIKRLKKLLLPLLLTNGFWWFYKYVIIKGELLSFFKRITFYSFWFEKEHAAWFVALIIVLYLLYPFIYKLMEDNKLTISMIVAFLICYYTLIWVFKYIDYKWYLNIEIALTRVPVYIVGAFCGKLVYNDETFDDKSRLLLFVLLIYGFIFFYYQPCSLIKNLRIPYLFIGPSLAIWISILLEIINNSTLNKQISLWGGRSLELYLSHLVLRDVFYKIITSNSNQKINFGIYIIICLFGAMIYSSSIKFVNNFVLDKRK